MSGGGPQADATARLTHLLGYVKEIAGLGRADADAATELPLSTDGPVVLHEAPLRKLLELRSADGQPSLWLSGDGRSGVWLKLRRPDGASSKDSALHKQACAVYATLFSLRQEALREGHGAQLMVGVGLIRGKIGATAVDHPLVLLPADLELDRDGALVVSMAHASQASLWPFPGLPAAAPGVVQINKCAQDYGLVGTNQPPAPSDREKWEPLLSRAAHCLASDGQYVAGPPKKTKGVGYSAHKGPLQVHNTFVLFSRDSESSGDHTVAKDADALVEALRQLPPGALPAALGRLAGVYGLPVVPVGPAAAPSSGFGSLLLRTISLGYLGGGAAAADARQDSFLYFGLPANEQQEAVVETLQRQGCAVLLGPPGTGKSQTIANVICHYLATGRRVLVTSKGEPATEVLRQMLPDGIRELTISLGGGDSGSFRRLEGAVEHLADHVAGAPADKLKEAAERLQQRFESIQKQIDDIEAADAKRAEKYFPPTSPDRAPLEGLHLHPENLEMLGLAHKSGCTMVNLADAVVEVLALAPAGAAGGGSTPSGSLPASAYFLEGISIDPTSPPPPQHVLDELCSLRRGCMSALHWEPELRSASANAPLSESYETHQYLVLAQRMREFTQITDEIQRGELPRINDPEVAQRLVEMLDQLHKALCEMDEKRAAAPRPSKRKKKNEPQPGSFLCQLLRHADNKDARKVVKNICVLTRRLNELEHHWGSQAGQLNIEVPQHVLDNLDKPPARPKPEELDLTDDPQRVSEVDEAVAGQNEFAAEVRWYAHPERRGMLGGLLHSKPNQSLQNALDEAKFDGRAPSNPHEWEHLEKVIVVRSCAARIKEQWEILGALTTSAPPLPPVKPTAQDAERFPEQVAAAISLGQYVSATHRETLEICVRAMELAKNLNSVAVSAVGSALEIMDALCAGPAECQAKKHKLMRSLASHRELASHLEARDQLFTELGSPDKESPLGVLQNAVQQLGSRDKSPEELTKIWYSARGQLREARASLTHVTKLRELAKTVLPPAWARQVAELRKDQATGLMLDPCPRDSRRLWAAVAAREAMRKDHRAIAGRDTGSAGAIQRLLGQRRTAVEALVVAVAKHALRQVMSAETCAGLVRLVSAVAAAGAAHGDGERASRYRADLTAAMNDCASAVPCWIMPTWRIAQCLPAQIGSFDLVVLDEASQSDVTALSALLRGKHVLVVGDQKQVSPTASFIAESRIRELKQSLLASHHPYVEQLLPGRSIFDLAQTCFADARVALTQHFRCVPQCIAFSNEQFYHGRLEPRRLPPQSERLEPALVDVFVRNGKKKGKVNEVEAAALVSYLKAELAEGSELASRGSTVGIISLMGVEQTRVLRRKVLEELSDAQLARHRVVVGDPSGFQGDERDVILLSMVASTGAAPAQVGRMYEQRFNVALSRARDRMVLFRSLAPGDIAGRGDDLKLHTMGFFGRAAAQPAGAAAGGAAAAAAAPAPAAAASGGVGETDESTVEGQLLSWLVQQGYRVDATLSVAGAAAVVEDYTTDRRICVCIDGTGGASLAEWCASVREQRGLERTGWSFVRLWHTNWLIDRADCEKRLHAAFQAAGVRPRGGSPRPGHSSATATAMEVTGAEAAPKRPKATGAKRGRAAAAAGSSAAGSDASGDDASPAARKPAAKRPRAGARKRG